MKQRLINVGDALSQLTQVILWPRASETNANESISGRAYREDRQRLIAIIDLLFFWDSDDDKGHCELAFDRDFRRAYVLINAQSELFEGKDASWH